MTDVAPTRVVVAGGGTAGWIAAMALARQLGRLVSVTLVESDDIGTIGVGEATIPTARSFHEFLRIDERAFVEATGATFKLGIQFENWARPGDRYLHSFGTFALQNWVADFQHFWLEARHAGNDAPIGAFCLEHEAALAGRFSNEGKPPLSYAYHLDAGRYGTFLRTIAENNGAQRVEGRIADVRHQPETGHIAALVLQDGREIEGDLFIDCTGFRALLIGQAMGSGYDDWTEWLATDAAWAVQTDNDEAPPPFTRAIAHEAGWQWRIPLQHRTGNGLVFASDYLDPEQAREKLLATVIGRPRTEPRLIRYKTGKRQQMWRGNCLALGLSSGFVEPLESTSIHLVMIGVTRLIQMFPFAGSTQAVRDRWNRMADTELEKVRDFIILHYKLTERDDSAFWRRCRDMAIPDSLRQRIASFADAAQAWQAPDDLFRAESWLQVMLGQRLQPQNWHRIGALMSEGRLERELGRQRAAIAAQVGTLPRHEDFIDRILSGKEHAGAGLMRSG